MNLKVCGWSKSRHDLMYHIAIYQQGVRKPVNPRVERRCPGRDLKPEPPEYETSMTLTRSETTCYVYLITLLGFLFVFCINVSHTLESRTRKYCFCCVRMCESILKAWQQRPPAYRQYPVSIHQALRLWNNMWRSMHILCGNKMPTRCNRGFYCTSYCLLNMFRAPLCPSSGAQEYYTLYSIIPQAATTV